MYDTVSGWKKTNERKETGRKERKKGTKGRGERIVGR